MRRGGCARRAMLGAVAAGALLGAARGYDITLDTKANAEPDPRADDEYTVVTTAGLEIVIGPKVGNEYDIASAVPSPNDNDLALSIAVEGGDKPVTDVAGSCPGGITLDASTGDIACYGFAKVDPIPAVGAGSIVPVGASITITPDVAGGFDFTTCEGDIDVQIDAGALGDIVCKDENGLVVQTAEGATSFTVTDDDSNDVSSTFTLVNCPGGITLDKSASEIVCVPAVGAGSIVPVGASITITPDVAGGFDFTTCEGDIDVQIDAGALGDIVCKDENGLVVQTAEGATSFTVTDDDSNDVSSTFTLVNCPGGITLDKSENEFVCYGVERGAAPVTNSVGGSIVVTETSEPNAALQEKTTIAGGTIDTSATITVTGGDALASEGTNYKIELNTVNGAFTETVTVDDGEAPNPLITETETKLDGTVTKTVTKSDGTVTETVKVTASSSTQVSIADLFGDIAALEDTITLPFADGTVIEIESKGADSGDLKVEVVTTELATTVTEYNIDYSTVEAGILGFIKEIKTEEESVTTTFFLTGDDSLPNPDGGEEDVTAGDYLDLFEEELSSSPTVATYRNRLPAGGKLPESFKDGETGEIKGEAILKFEIEGTSYITLFDDPSRLALTANLTTQVSDGTPSRKLLQQEVVAETETEFRSQIDDDDNIEESLKEVEKDANGNVIRFSANETKIEEDPKTGFITLTEIETVNGGTEEQVVTENELVLTSIGGATTVVSQKTTVDGQETFCDPPFAIVCGGSGSAPAPSPDNGGGGGGGPAPVPSPDNG